MEENNENVEKDIKEETVVEEINDKNVEIVDQKKKSKKSLIIILLVLVIIIVLVVLFLMKNNKKENIVKPTNTNNNNNTEIINTEKEIFKNDYVITKNSLDNFDLSFLKLENNKKNVIYSPLSIKYALGMLMQGANNETKKQINDILGNYKFHKFNNNKNMSFANALFIKNSFKKTINDKFVSNLKKNFNADVKYDNFKSPDIVNNYVKEKTFNLIDKIVDNIEEDDYILLNALAIDMNWKNRIQPDYNEDDKEPDDVFGVYFNHLKYYKSIDYLGMTDYHELSFDNDPIARQSVEIGAVINNYDIVKILGKDKIKEIVMEDYNNWIAKGAPDACEECNYDEDDEDDEGNCTQDTSFDFDKYLKELNNNYGYIDSSTDFRFYVDDNVKVFNKSLKKYGDTTLEYLAIMPTKEELSDYIKRINESDINSLIKKLKKIESKNFKDGVITEITGYIPLFNYDYELNLIKDLNSLGVVDVFDSEKADLSNLSNTKSYINSALHKANIDFSNEGIKASAVTMGGGRGAGDCGYDYLFLPPVEVIDLTFNKPFIYFIMDKSTGEVWFVGSVYKPSKYKSYSETYYELHPDEFDEDDEDDYEDYDEEE